MGKKFNYYNKPAPEPAKVEEPVVEGVEAVEPEEIYVDAVIEGAGMLNIRSTPEVKVGNIIGIFSDETPCKILKNKDGGDWFRIIVGDPEVKGFAMKKYIKVN